MYQCYDGGYPFGSYQNNQNSAASVREIRLELDGFEVPLGSDVDGRIYFEVDRSVRLSSIDLTISRPFVMVSSQGVIRASDKGTTRVRHLPRSKFETSRYNPDYNAFYGYGNVYGSESKPVGQSGTTITSAEPVDKSVNLGSGQHAIPFTLQVAEKEWPTFTYVNSENGATVAFCQTLRADVNIGGKSFKTEAIHFEVPAIGPVLGGAGLQDDNSGMLIVNKVVKRNEPIQIAVGEIKKKAKKVRVQVIQKINSQFMGLSNRAIQISPWKSPVLNKKGNSDFLDAYLRNQTINPTLAEEWSRCWQAVFSLDDGPPPTINTPEFSLDYFVQVDIDGTVYEAQIVLIDQYQTMDTKAPQLNAETLRRNTFSRTD